MDDRNRDIDVVSQLAPLRRYAHSLTRNQEDAEDLVHETLLRAIERGDRFQVGRKLRPWLMSILHNHFMDEMRRKRTRRSADATMAIHAQTVATGGQEESARFADVRRAFMMLPDEQRAALHLVTVEGLSYDEAATSLGVPVGTLVSRLSRGRARLRELEDGAPATRVVPFRATRGRDAS